MTRRSPPARTTLHWAGLLLVVACLFGGGGSPSPLAEAAVEVAALAILAVAIALGLRPVGAMRRDPVLALTILAVAVLPLVQLLPLPPAVTGVLPGRDAADAARGLAGAAGDWHGWSLAPDATLAGALALLPALAMVVLAAALPPRDRVRLVAVLTVAGAVAALLGLAQFARGEAATPTFYREVHRGWGIGFFANRNAQADFVAVALAGLVLLADRWRARLSRAEFAGVTVAGLVMLAGGVASGSRMGMVSLAVPVALAIVVAGRRGWVPALGLAAGAALLIVGGTTLDRVAARVHDNGARAEIWGDGVYVARSLLPMGGGVGSFQPLYTAAERLDHVQPTIANRAHDDYLELAIEAGVPALALLAAVLALVARRSAAGWRAADPDRRLLARFATLTTLILALHSIVDYPLRTLTLLTVAALALAGLAFDQVASHTPAGAGDVADAQG